MKVATEERGWAGHFCMADRCSFRRNTLVSYGNKRIVVSTVGNCIEHNKIIEIGYHRYYETMIFWSKLDGIYWDADVSYEISSDVGWSVDKIEETSDKVANEMHENNVKWVVDNIKTLKRG